jgi:uncharacterized membrane protein YqjE
MSGGDKISAGLAGLLKAIGRNLAAISRSRLELFSIEIQEERHRLIQGLIWASAAIFCGAMAFIMMNITLVYLFWENARLAVLLILTLFYTLLLAAIAIGFGRYLKKQRPPFADTIREFQKDYECFRGEN